MNLLTNDQQVKVRISDRNFVADAKEIALGTYKVVITAAKWAHDGFETGELDGMDTIQLTPEELKELSKGGLDLTFWVGEYSDPKEVEDENTLYKVTLFSEDSDIPALTLTAWGNELVH